MLDMKKTGNSIKNARTKKNMTQLELADLIGVSYQAVSNWERGNSMPDIAKIPDISRILGLDIAELLGEQKDDTAAKAVEKAIADPEATLSAKELVEIAPILPPSELEKKTEKTAGQKELNIKAIVELAPYLDEEYLDKLVGDLTDVGNIEDIVVLAPFLSDEALDEIASKIETARIYDLVELAPFLSDEALDRIADRIVVSGEDGLEELAPFLSDETLDKLVDKFLQEGKTSDIIEVAPFLSDESIRKVADRLLKDKDIEGLAEIKDYL